MKEWKIKIVDRLLELSKELHAFSIRRAALDCGVNHVATQECMEMKKAFQEKCPEFKAYRTCGHSVFTTLFFTDNECPYPDTDCEKEFVDRSLE